MDHSSLVAASKDSVSTQLDGEEVILNMTSGRYFGLNDVGALVWGKLKDPVSVGELSKAIQDEYDVEAEQCDKDLDGLLEQLIEKGLVEVK